MLRFLAFSWVIFTVLCHPDIQPKSVESGGTRISKFHVNSMIQSRFATTNITSVIVNLEDVAKEIVFKAVLPNAAFISGFTMTVDGKTFVADVKEKAEAQETYDKAKARGQTAGLAAQSVRETNTFEISSNVAAKGTVQFDLMYQEILERVEGVYKHIININPGQAVDDMRIDLVVAEKAEISKFKVPAIEPRIGEKTNSELMALSDSTDVSTSKQISSKLSTVTTSYTPTAEMQKEHLGENLSGQFVALYDVTRDASAGEIQVVDGYFVQFFAPTGLPQGTKRIVFVLDISGSMSGLKMDQMKEAMSAILSDMKESDVFNIVVFSTAVEPWKNEMMQADASHISEAQEYIRSLKIKGSTAIHAALQKGIEMLDAEKSPVLVSMMVFLTDGMANVGESRPAKIVEDVKEWNSNKHRIHCVAFGSDAQYEMLKKISVQNHGIARKVFVDSDAGLQLKGFYNEISSPLLSDVKVDYLDESVDTNTIVLNGQQDYTEGKEVMVFGKLHNGLSNLSQRQLADNDGSGEAEAAMIEGSVAGAGAAGKSTFAISRPVPCWDLCAKCPINARRRRRRDMSSEEKIGSLILPPLRCACSPICEPPEPKPAQPLAGNTVGGVVERMWAYMTIKKLMEQAKYKEADTAKQAELKKKALDLSLRYHFVSEVTSLVVTQDSADTKAPSLVDSDSKPGSRGGFAGGSSGGRSATGAFSTTMPRQNSEAGGPLRPRPGALPSKQNKAGQAAIAANSEASGSASASDKAKEMKPAAGSGDYDEAAPAPASASGARSKSEEEEEKTSQSSTGRSSESRSNEKNSSSATCNFKTGKPDSVSYDKSTLLRTVKSSKSRNDCENTCSADDECELAVWLPTSQECLLYSDDSVDCSADSETIPDSAPVILFCKKC